MKLPTPHAAGSSVLLAIAAGGAILPSLTTATHHIKWIGGAVFLSTLAGNLALLERRESFARDRQRFLIDQACGGAIEYIRQKDTTARMNIMRVQGLYGFRKFEFFRTYHMEKDLDADLSLGLHQGVAGAAYKHRTWAVGDFEQNVCVVGNAEEQFRDPCRHFTQNQRDRVKDLKLAYSFPIRQLARHGEAGDVKPVDNVIGVVNIDSRMTGALKNAETTGLHKEILETLLPNIATVAAYIMV